MKSTIDINVPILDLRNDNSYYYRSIRTVTDKVIAQSGDPIASTTPDLINGTINKLEESGLNKNESLALISKDLHEAYSTEIANDILNYYIAFENMNDEFEMMIKVGMEKQAINRFIGNPIDFNHENSDQTLETLYSKMIDQINSATEQGRDDNGELDDLWNNW